MLPYSEILEGDVYSKDKCLGSCEFIVLEKKERLVKVVAISARTSEQIGEPFWLKPSASLFSERNRLQRGLSI